MSGTQTFYQCPGCGREFPHHPAEPIESCEKCGAALILAEFRPLTDAEARRLADDFKFEQCRDDWQAAIEERDEALARVEELTDCLRRLLAATDRCYCSVPTEELLAARADAMAALEEEQEDECQPE